MTTQEIDKLIAEYNQAEIEQGKRLERLFKAIDGRTGYRHVKFSNGGIWSNCWGNEYRIMGERMVSDMTGTIQAIQHGGD